MKLCRPISRTSLSRILLVFVAIFLTLCIGHVRPAHSASEPGTVTIVLETEPPNLDPGDTEQKGTGQVLMKNVVEPLVEVNPNDGKILPRLATSWKQIDRNTWQFFLRKGVKFHDGKDFNAEAVIFSIKRIYNKKIDSKSRSKYFSHFQMESKALNSHTVEIKTDKFEPLMLSLMGVLPICSPDTSFDVWTRQPVGTGPYKLVKWDVGTQILLERFGGYWGKKPPVQKAIYLWRSEPSVRATMVLIGEADLVLNIAKQDANRPDMDSSYLNSDTLGLRMATWEPPFNDRRVRMALNYAVDRDAIRGSILSKDVIPATQLVVPNIFGHNPNLKVGPYDLKMAKKLLDEARKDGVPVDKEILLLGRAGYFPGSDELMEAVMAMFKDVGLNVKLKTIESSVMRTYRYKPFPKNAGPYIVELMHDNNAGDAVFTCFFNYHCQGNTSFMCDKTVDDLIDRAQVATGEERRKLWQSAFKRVHEEVVPEIMLFHMVAHARVGKRINFKPLFTSILELPLEQISFK